MHVIGNEEIHCSTTTLILLFLYNRRSGIDCGWGYNWVDEGDDYVPQTNFDFKFVKKVLPPSQLNDYSGFVVEVTHTIGPTQRKG